MNFKKRLCFNKGKEVIANNVTNNGASETKVCSHVGEPLFSYLCFFLDFPPKWVSPLVLNSNQLSFEVLEFLEFRSFAREQGD